MVVEAGGTIRDKKSADANSTNGADLTLAQAQSAAFYSEFLSTWNYTDTWAIREGASYPYFQYQSAPVSITAISALNVSLNTTTSSQMEVYKGSDKALLATLNTAIGDNRFLLSDIAVGDTLYFVNLEEGKAPSYPVRKIIADPGLATVTFEITEEDGTPISDAVITFNEVTNTAGNYTFTNITVGTYAYSVSKTGYATQTGTVKIENDHTVEIILLQSSNPSGISGIQGNLSARLYPNPVTDKLNVSVDESISQVQVEVIGVTGKKYLSQLYYTPSFSIDLSKYPTGVLLVKLSTQEGSVVKTIVKQAQR
jgi:hypothetical protein